MHLRVVDGRNLGGRAFEMTIQQYINDTDALVALYMPQADTDGKAVLPPYVVRKFQYAKPSANGAAHRALGIGRSKRVDWAPMTSTYHIARGDPLEVVMSLRMFFRPEPVPVTPLNRIDNLIISIKNG